MGTDHIKPLLELRCGIVELSELVDRRLYADERGLFHVRRDGFGLVGLDTLQNGVECGRRLQLSTDDPRAFLRVWMREQKLEAARLAELEQPGIAVTQMLSADSEVREHGRALLRLQLLAVRSLIQSEDVADDKVDGFGRSVNFSGGVGEGRPSSTGSALRSRT